MIEDPIQHEAQERRRRELLGLWFHRYADPLPRLEDPPEYSGPPPLEQVQVVVVLADGSPALL